MMTSGWSTCLPGMKSVVRQMEAVDLPPQDPPSSVGESAVSTQGLQSRDRTVLNKSRDRHGWAVHS